jgi:hypothetical protein
MAHILRLVLVLLLGLSSVSSYALVPTLVVPPDVAANWAQQIADHRPSCVAGQQVWCYTLSGTPPHANQACLFDGWGNTVDCQDLVPSFPSNCTPDPTNSFCTCNTGYDTDPVNNRCVPHPPPAPVNNCPKSGSPGGGWNGPGGTGPKTICAAANTGGADSGDTAKPGCLLTGYSSLAAGSAGPGQTWVANMAYSGASCDPSASSGGGGPATTPGVPDAPNACVPPKVAGTVNGVVVCYTPTAGTGPPTASSNSSTATTTSPDGSTSAVTTSVTVSCTGGVCTRNTTTSTVNTPAGGVAGDPVVTTSTSTCNQGPGCSIYAPTTQVTTTTPTSGGTGGTGGSQTGTGSTTTTVTTGGGGGGRGGNGTGEGDGPQSSFQGTCQAGYTCDGDAIMCAMAQEQYRRDCKLYDDYSSAELQKVQAEMAKTGDRTTEIAANETVTISASSFDTSDALGGGSCIQDAQVTVWGHAQSIPFSKVCPQLALLGNALLLVSFLLATRIVSRG